MLRDSLQSHCFVVTGMTDLISSWFLGTVHRKLQLLAQYLWTDFTTFFQTLIGPLRSNLNQAYNHVSGLTDNLTLSISMLQSLQTQSDRSQNRLSEELKGNSRFASIITITHNELNRKKKCNFSRKNKVVKTFFWFILFVFVWYYKNNVFCSDFCIL